MIIISNNRRHRSRVGSIVVALTAGNAGESRVTSMWHGLVAKAASTVVTGAVGVAAYEAVRKAVAKVPAREVSVNATALGLRGVRRAEEAAERARLAVGDVVAEARERIGEEAPPPIADAGHDHDH